MARGSAPTSTLARLEAKTGELFVRRRGSAHGRAASTVAWTQGRRQRPCLRPLRAEWQAPPSLSSGSA